MEVGGGGVGGGGVTAETKLNEVCFNKFKNVSLDIYCKIRNEQRKTNKNS